MSRTGDRKILQDEHDCARQAPYDRLGYPAMLRYGQATVGFTVWPSYESLCQARRCTNGCGCFEHSKPAELPAGCLRHDLATSYVEGNWCGPGLIVQLEQALARPSAARQGEGGTRNKPGSRPPGWNADASELLADIRARATVADRDTLEDWRRQARTVLGFAVPSVGLADFACPACGMKSMRVAQDAASDIWCSERWCHDDDKHPDCWYDVDELGYPADLGYGEPVVMHLACRRTEQSLTHSVRFPRHSWGPLWTQKQAGDRELEQVPA